MSDYLVVKWDLPEKGHVGARMWMLGDPGEKPWTLTAREAVAFSDARSAADAIAALDDESAVVVPLINNVPVDMNLLAFALRVLGNEAHAAPRGNVYVAMDGGPESTLKIGWSKYGAAGRVKQLRTGNPRGIALLTDFPASLRVEGALHRALRHYRVTGEWFRNEPFVVGLVHAVRSFCLVKAAGRA